MRRADLGAWGLLVWVLGAPVYGGAQERAAEVDPATAAATTTTTATATATATADGTGSGDEVDGLIDRMVRARTRLAAIGEALFKTRLKVVIDNRSKHTRVLRVRLFVDGAPVHEGDGSGLVRGEEVALYSGYAAPGMHDVRIEVESAAQADGAYEYGLGQRFRFRAVADQQTEVRIRLEGEADIAEDFDDDGEGTYDVRTRVRVRATPLQER